MEAFCIPDRDVRRVIRADAADGILLRHFSGRLCLIAGGPCPFTHSPTGRA